jgi:hypothetical protein
VTSQNLLKRYIRPAVKRAGIEGKIIGWPNFRYLLAMNLQAMGVGVKVAQEIIAPCERQNDAIFTPERFRSRRETRTQR